MCRSKRIFRCCEEIPRLINKWDLVRSTRAKSVYSRTNIIVAAFADRCCRSHPPSLKLRRTSRLRLQIAAVEKNCSGAFHFIERAVDVPGLQINSAAAVQDHVRVQAELARIEHAVLHAAVQSDAHQVNVVDLALLQVMRESGVAAMRVVEKRAVTNNGSLDPFVKHMSDSACVE